MGFNSGFKGLNGGLFLYILCGKGRRKPNGTLAPVEIHKT